MIVKKINLVKKNGDKLYKCHPASSADVIEYEGSLTVKDALDTIIETIENIENILASNNITMNTNTSDT